MSNVKCTGIFRRLWYSYIIFRDKCRHVDFYALAENGEQGCPPPEIGTRYMASSPLYNRSIYSYLCRQDHTCDAIMDVGCGKGRMLEFFSRFGFQKVAGLEYSPELTEIARKNMRTLHLDCEVLRGDAADFDGYDSYNYYYLFNPFPQAVMEQFAGKLKESLGRNPRQITVIYTYAKCLSAFTNNGFYSRQEGYGKHKFYVITNFSEEA